MASVSTPWRRLSIPLAGLLFLLACTTGLTAWGLSARLDHDEHQFVASGVLLARDGLLPYRDFPYHHFPYLVFLDAFVFSATEHVLLAARSTSVAFAVASIVLIMHLVHSAFDGLRPWLQFWLAVAFAIAFAANPVFMYATGRAWNHDASVFFALAAFACMHRAAHTPQYAKWLALSGAALGIAIGIRSSFALVVPGFLFGAVTLHRGAGLRDAIARIAVLTVGMGLALVPMLPLAVLAPQQFWYGNVGYNLELHPAYHRLLGHGSAMSLWGKLEYLLYEVAPVKGNLALVLASLATFGAVVARPGRRFVFEVRLLSVLLPCLLLAALSPSLTWYQYFYPLVPFLLLAIAFACADHRAMRLRAAALGGAGVLLAGSVLALRHYAQPFRLAPREWTAICLHELGTRIASRVGQRRVLTLGPILPLEGGASIYPELVTGPFTWRTAPLISTADRAKLRVAGPAELEGLLTAEMPAGILTGVEASSRQRLEDPLVTFASAHGYRPRPLNNGLTLWSKDAQVGGEQVVDGAACAFNAD
jgi:4-amino-4-deoxy-L-arabinose transferase-like glycosyltransferase